MVCLIIGHSASLVGLVYRWKDCKHGLSARTNFACQCGRPCRQNVTWRSVPSVLEPRLSHFFWYTGSVVDYWHYLFCLWVLSVSKCILFIVDSWTPVLRNSIILILIFYFTIRICLPFGRLLIILSRPAWSLTYFCTTAINVWSAIWKHIHQKFRWYTFTLILNKTTRWFF